MPDSDFVFEQGEPITVGSHGETDYVFSSGTPVLNNGKSNFVFESGVGLGGVASEWFEDWAAGNLNDYTTEKFREDGNPGTLSADVTTTKSTLGDYSLELEAENTGGGASDNYVMVKAKDNFSLLAGESFTVSLDWSQSLSGDSFNSKSRIWITDGSKNIRIVHRGPDDGSPSSQGWLVGDYFLEFGSTGSAYQGGDFSFTEVKLRVDYSSNSYSLLVDGSEVLSGGVNGTWDNPSNLVVRHRSEVEGGANLTLWHDNIRVVQDIV